MKKVSMLATIVSLFVGGAPAPSAFGLTGNQAYIDYYHGRTDIPVPVRVVTPDAETALAGTKVEVEFLVDSTGRPQNIRILSATDRDFGLSVRNAVRQWEFSPARPNGTAVPMKVMLPVVVTPSE